MTLGTAMATFASVMTARTRIELTLQKTERRDRNKQGLCQHHQVVDSELLLGLDFPVL